MKFDRLTTAQRVRIDKTNYRNSYSNMTTFDVLREDFDACNRPTTEAIGIGLRKRD